MSRNSNQKRFILHDDGYRERAIAYLRELPLDVPWEVVTKRYHKPRSDNQHGYLRVLLTIISEHTGFSHEELLELFCEEAGLMKTVSIGGVQKEVRKSTNEINVVEMIELIDTIIRVCAEQIELHLPPPKQMYSA